MVVFSCDGLVWVLDMLTTKIDQPTLAFIELQETTFQSKHIDIRTQLPLLLKLGFDLEVFNFLVVGEGQGHDIFDRTLVHVEGASQLPRRQIDLLSLTLVLLVNTLGSIRGGEGI